MATETERTQFTKLDPEFAEVLKSLPQRAPPPLDVASIREMTAERTKQKGKYLKFDVSGVDEKDLQIPGRDGINIPARVYRPQTPPSSGSPVVVVFHGGGFCVGNLDSEALTCRLYTKTLGAVCVDVEYRLAPEAPFPAAPNDAWDAVKWVAAHASSTLGADPSKGFIVAGTSAGGNLTDVVGHLARDEKLSPPLTGLLEKIPIICPKQVMPEKYGHLQTSYEENAINPVIPKGIMDFFDGNYKPDHKSPLSAPFNWPSGHRGLPPICLMVCGADPLRDEALIYERVLREELGAKTRLMVYPGLPHGFWSFFPMLSHSTKFINDELDCMKWLLEQQGQ